MEYYCLFLTPTKIKNSHNKAVDNYSHPIKLVPECYKTQEMCDKVVGDYPSAIQIVRD